MNVQKEFMNATRMQCVRIPKKHILVNVSPDLKISFQINLDFPAPFVSIW